jgi:hypothetical protein
MMESRIEPHKKAHFSLHISDRIANSDDASGNYSSVKCEFLISRLIAIQLLIQSSDNHKPAHTSDTRTTTLTPLSSTDLYNLRLEDTEDSRNDKDIFTFTGQRSQLKKSYVLVFDASSQQATLEPLSSSYTFNLAAKNGKDISSQHTKIYPKKTKDNTQDKDEDEHLFGGAAAEDEGGDPDPDNPYDFRHFLSKEKEKRGDESEYHFASSPDYRTGTGSAVNTPQFGARGTVTAPARKAAAPVPKKRKTTTTNPMVKPKKPQSTPAVRLQRTATADTTPGAKSKATAPPASKIKSSEVVHSSDESDGEAVSPPPPQSQRYHDSNEDAEGESDDDGGLEIEVPDARPPRRGKGALASLGLGQNIGAGYLRSPSNGPISLASAANSDVEASPNPHARNRNTQEEIDFGDLGGEDAEGEDDDGEYGNDWDVEHMDIGPPRQETERKSSVGGGEAVEDDEDDLEELMRRGLEGGDSSEESEESEEE